MDQDIDAIKQDVLERFYALVEKFHLTDISVFTSGCVALVCAAVCEQQQVVVKITPRLHDRPIPSHQYLAMSKWNEMGITPNILAALDDGYTQILERVGDSLEDTDLGTDEKLRVAGTLAASMHQVKVSALEGFDPAKNRLMRPSLAQDIQAENTLNHLHKTTTRNVLLHGDLHLGNILRRQEEWVVIDPHGLYGDAASETAPLLHTALKLPESKLNDKAIMNYWIGVYSRAAEIDEERLRLWLSVQLSVELIQTKGSNSLQARKWRCGYARIKAVL